MGVVDQQLDRMGIRLIQPGLTGGGHQPADRCRALVWNERGHGVS